ncbi:hypothetical protein GE061_005186 [Apolygus lucorum]|uniref:Uncharacterized protein n=1 Tax=Apolygus lucorum TaxID=248454 RepID=A0A6A4IXB4_APOLU|nr:hypothetical protein GE061_005186 [Apolygus lucorum]
MILKTLFLVTFTALYGLTDTAHCPSCASCNFPDLTKEDFCTGNFNIFLDPKYIPLLVTYFKYCYDTMKEPNEVGSFRRHVLVNLLDSATPVVHKAYFNSKTGLKHVGAFTKVKLAVLEFCVYSDSIESDVDPQHRWKTTPFNSRIYYSPGACSGSYVMRDDILLCQQLMCSPCKNCDALDKTRLMSVSKLTREILFPLLNLTIPLQSDDTPYTILDMYTLAKRCLGYTDVGPAGASAECDSILCWIRKEILPFVNPVEFEKTCNDIHRLPMKPCP